MYIGKGPGPRVVDGCDPWPDGPASTSISVISGIESECVYWVRAQATVWLMDVTPGQVGQPALPSLLSLV